MAEYSGPWKDRESLIKAVVHGEDPELIALPVDSEVTRWDKAPGTYFTPTGLLCIGPDCEMSTEELRKLHTRNESDERSWEDTNWRDLPGDSKIAGEQILAAQLQGKVRIR